MYGPVPESLAKQTGWARQARNRIRKSKYVLSQNQYVHGMYRLEMKETWNKIEKNSTYLVRTGTYRVVLIYSTVPPCAALYLYVLFTPSTYRVRTIFTLYVPSTYLSKTVCTEYALSTESMIKVRT